jgi:hypothetical protein
MKNKLFVFAILASFSILFSCTSKTSETNAAIENQAAAESATPKGKYAIKSGIVQYKTEMMGMEVMQTLTFDDYGKKEATDVEMEMMGVKMHTVNLTKDGFIYNLDMVKKTGTKSPAVNLANSSIDFENLSEELVKDMDLKKLGTEEFLGKTCEKMSIDYKKMSMKGTFLVFKGVALKSETDMGSMKMKLIAEKFEENTTIPAEKFEVPADIKIQDMK